MVGHLSGRTSDTGSIGREHRSGTLGNWAFQGGCQMKNFQSPVAALNSWLGALDTTTNRQIARHPHVRVTFALIALTAILLASWRFLPVGRELRLEGYLPLHTFLETCSIVVSVLIFIVSRSRIGDKRNRNMVLLGAAFLGVALLDYLHAHSYMGMPDLVTPANPSKAINFWLAARLMAASALLAVAFMSWERLVPAAALHRAVGATLALVALVSLVFLYRPHWMPETFVAGRGLTPFKIYAELLIIALSCIAAIGFHRLILRPRPRGEATGLDPTALMAASIVTALAEILFTLYTEVDGLFNVLGHVYKVIGAWFLYRGLIATNLFEIETRSKLTLEAAQLGAWTWEIDSDTIEWSEAAAQVWGLPANDRPQMKTLDRLIHPDDLDAKRAAIARALDPRTDGSYVAEYRIIIPADGAVHHVASRGRTEFRDGRPVRIIGVIRDATARGFAEAVVRQSEARLSGILSIAADAIISIDQRHRINLFNQGAETIFGYAPAEVIGQPLDMLLPERFRGRHDRHIEQFAASAASARRMGERSEIFGLRKDGTEFPAEASISRLAIDAGIVFTVVLRDITQRKQVEVQLEQRVVERTAELSALVDALPDGISRADLDRRLRTANAAMTRLFGYAREELVGLHASVLYASPTDNEAMMQAWSEWERGHLATPITVECRRKDGSTFTAMVLGNVVRDKDGRISGSVGIFRDISDELKRQKALAQAQRMEAFGQLTGGIAHDFNNLLTVISGNQELLEMRLDDAKDLALLRRSQEAAEMGARLTARLLTFARRRQLEPTILNLNEQIIAMTELLQRSIGDHVTLKTNLAPNLGTVRADACEIENAVLNLAINARDAMPNGGSLSIDTAEHRVASGDAGEPLLAPGRYVRLAIADTGTGMTPEVQRQAFEPFFTTKQPGKGTGLGLSTIHGFAQQSGGAATITSEPGRGTTVSVYLPVVSAGERRLDVSETSTEAPRGHGERVLLVEDNADVRAVARQRLDALGYDVTEADSGPAAVERLEQPGSDFAIVFSDVVMPGGMSGYDLALWLAANRPHIKLLLTSGYPGDAPGGASNQLREIRLLPKPYSTAELARAMRQAIGPAATIVKP